VDDHSVDKTTASEKQFSLLNSILFHAFDYFLTIVYCLHYAMYILCEIITLFLKKEKKNVQYFIIYKSRVPDKLEDIESMSKTNQVLY